MPGAGCAPCDSEAGKGASDARKASPGLFANARNASVDRIVITSVLGLFVNPGMVCRIIKCAKNFLRIGHFKSIGKNERAGDK
jgi:hypothetical protein